MNEEKIIRFLNNLSSTEERIEVMTWLDKPGSEKEIVKFFEDRWDTASFSQIDDEKARIILEEIHKATRAKENVSTKTKILGEKFAKWGRIAASYLLLGFSIYFLREGFLYEKPTASSETSIVNLVERKTQVGEKLRIILPDKSSVVLNSLSTIKFFSDFGKSSRELEIEGEAFFDVSENKELPFLVKVGGISTEALGTAFNVFGRQGKVKISLTEGKVRVSNRNATVDLLPGEMATYQMENSKGLVKTNFDIYQAIMWKEGEISFKSKKFGDILTTLEEWYGVEILVQGELNRNREITGVFKNENLKDILTGLGYFMSFEFNLDGKKVTLKSKSPMV